MFSNFYLVKSHKIANNSATAEASEKISTDLESAEIKKKFDLYLTKLENYQILPSKSSQKFLVTTKLFTGWKRLIMRISFTDDTSPTALQYCKLVCLSLPVPTSYTQVIFIVKWGH